MHSKLVLSVLVLGVAASAIPASGALLSNGGFETPAIGAATFQVVNPGAEPAGFAWMVVAGNVDIFSDGVLGTSATAVEGTQALDLVGTGVSTGAIERTFATTAGETYLLTFVYADNPISTGAASGLVTVMDGGNLLLSQIVNHNTSTTADFFWTGFSQTFVASGTAATLAFSDASGILNGGVFLDAISVDLAPSTGGGDVPEPSSAILLGSALAGVFAFRRRLIAR